jgi:hypothetical protein
LISPIKVSGNGIPSLIILALEGFIAVLFIAVSMKLLQIDQRPELVEGFLDSDH